MIIVPVVVLLGGIIGSDLALSPPWATLPVSIMVVGVALFTIPAALLLRQQITPMPSKA